MKQKGRSNTKEDETFIDKLKVIGFVGTPLWILLFFFCCVGISECHDKHQKKTVSSPPYRLEEINNHRSLEQITFGERRTFKAIQSKEIQLLDELYNDDYYDYSEYYDGLDGEHSDIDYNDIVDYFED